MRVDTCGLHSCVRMNVGAYACMPCREGKRIDTLLEAIQLRQSMANLVHSSSGIFRQRSRRAHQLSNPLLRPPQRQPPSHPPSHRRTLRCHAVPCRAISCRAMPSHTMPCCALRFMPCPAPPCPALPPIRPRPTSGAWSHHMCQVAPLAPGSQWVMGSRVVGDGTPATASPHRDDTPTYATWPHEPALWWHTCLSCRPVPLPPPPGAPLPNVMRTASPPTLLRSLHLSVVAQMAASVLKTEIREKSEFDAGASCTNRWRRRATPAGGFANGCRCCHDRRYPRGYCHRSQLYVAWQVICCKQQARKHQQEAHDGEQNRQLAAIHCAADEASSH